MDEHDQVLVGANSKTVHSIVEFTKQPAVAVVKRALALRPWRHSTIGEQWNPLLSPSAYADLLEGSLFDSISQRLRKTDTQLTIITFLILLLIEAAHV